MKNVLKIEKNEELNYEFGKQNPTSTKLVGFFCMCPAALHPACREGGWQAVCLPGRHIIFIRRSL